MSQRDLNSHADRGPGEGETGGWQGFASEPRSVARTIGPGSGSPVPLDAYRNPPYRGSQATPCHPPRRLYFRRGASHRPPKGPQGGMPYLATMTKKTVVKSRPRATTVETAAQRAVKRA